MLTLLFLEIEFLCVCVWYAGGSSGVAGGVAWVERRDLDGDEVDLILDWLPVFEASTL